MQVADYAWPIQLSPNQLKARISTTLADLMSLSVGTEGRLEIRVIGVVLPARYEYFERKQEFGNVCSACGVPVEI
jgi:hypothetical protein